MKYTKFVLFVSILMLAILPLLTVSAQDESPSEDSLMRSISLGSEAMIISSPTNDTDYLIHVNLPSGYSTSRSYPVLYLFDPWYTFGTITDQTRLLPYGGFPQIIVVGVGYSAILEQGGISKMSRLRNRDLSPDQQPEPFLEFLTETLIPYIDSTYNTDPNDRAIMGHSAGGDFVLYAFFNAPGTFQRFVAASPGTVSYESVCISCELENSTDISGIVYLSSGEFDREAPQYVEDAFSILQEQSDTNLNLTVSKEIFEGTNHLTVIPSALSRGLTNIYCGESNKSGACQLISIQPIYSVDDVDFPPGKIFTTQDEFLFLKNKLTWDAINVGSCRNMEATVLQAVGYLDGPVWIQLECEDNTGWVPKRLLDG